MSEKHILLYSDTGFHASQAGLELTMLMKMTLNLCPWACREAEHYDREGIQRRAIHLMASRTHGEETGRDQLKIEHAPNDLLLPSRPYLQKFLLLPKIASSAREPSLRGHFIPKQ